MYTYRQPDGTRITTSAIAGSSSAKATSVIRITITNTGDALGQVRLDLSLDAARYLAQALLGSAGDAEKAA